MSGLNGAEGKTYSSVAVRNYIENRVAEAGGVKVTEGRIPTAASDPLGDDVKVGMILGLGDIYNDPTSTYVIRRTDSIIWIHFVTNDLFGSWTIAEKRS
jgi:OOP family OmpA-OmpF porin